MSGWTFGIRTMGSVLLLSCRSSCSRSHMMLWRCLPSRSPRTSCSVPCGTPCSGRLGPTIGVPKTSCIWVHGGGAGWRACGAKFSLQATFLASELRPRWFSYQKTLVDGDLWHSCYSESGRPSLARTFEALARELGRPSSFWRIGWPWSRKLPASHQSCHGAVG